MKSSSPKSLSENRRGLSQFCCVCGPKWDCPLLRRVSRTGSKSRLAGFTLVELLVVMAIIGVLVALLLPAVQAAREAARRSTCQGRMMQLMLAVQNYQAARESLPSGVVNPEGPIRNEPVGYHHNWLEPLLPYLDEGTAYEHIDFSAGVYDEKNAAVRKLRMVNFICPSEVEQSLPASNYAGCHHDIEAPIDADNRGVLFLNSRIAEGDVSDGASHTIFLGEKIFDPGDLGWMSGTRATLRNTGLAIGSSLPGAMLAGTGDDPAKAAEKSPVYVVGFASYHPGVAVFGFGDGSVLVVSDEIDKKLLRQLANRADGELTDDASLR
jgi:prepilin-type N-terminal cleavage/methylation domain-containing protein